MIELAENVLFVATVDSHIKNFHLPYIKMFKEHGYQVHVATNGNETFPGCDCKYVVPFSRTPFSLSNVKAYITLRKIIKENNYQYICTNTPVGGVIGRLAAISSTCQTKVVYTAHGFHFYKGAPKLNWMIYYPIERVMARFTDILITINREDYEIAKFFHLRKGGKVYQIKGIGIDVNHFKNYEINREEERRKYGIESNDILLLNVGELSKRKNQMVIIQMMKHLDARYKLIICGEGALRQIYQEEIDRSKINNRVYLIGNVNDVEKYYKMADIFIFPSLQEGMPCALMEAIASGLPIVASDIRGNNELIHYANGFLVNLSDGSQEFANAVSEVYQCREEYKETYLYDFDIDSVRKEVEKILL